MTPILLTNRLRTIAEMVRQDAYFADIGTDHGYLPIYLVQTGRVSRGIAADVNPKPLQQAVQAIQKYGLGELITPLLSDGLQEVDPAVEDIAIAGMGGELIASILSASAWIQSSEKRLLLQPMTQEDFLRHYLAKNGFCVTEERVAEEGRHLYVILKAQYDGQKRTLTEAEALVGIAGKKVDSLSRKYLQKKLDKFEKIATGLRKAGDFSGAEQKETLIKELMAYLIS